MLLLSKACLKKAQLHLFLSLALIFGGVVDLFIESKIGFSRFASLGNEMDVSEAEMIEYFGEDPQVDVIAVYLKEPKTGARFMEAARKISKQKPIILLKAGKNNAGASGQLTYRFTGWGIYSLSSCFEQTGVSKVQNHGGASSAPLGHWVCSPCQKE